MRLLTVIALLAGLTALVAILWTQPDELKAQELWELDAQDNLARLKACRHRPRICDEKE